MRQTLWGTKQGLPKLMRRSATHLPQREQLNRSLAAQLRPSVAMALPVALNEDSQLTEAHKPG